MHHCRWQLLPPPPQESLSPDWHPLLVQLLHNRGISQVSNYEPFLAADTRLSYDPYLLPDMPQAVSRIYQALMRGEKIAVYGDFDADGITATVLLVQGLTALGCQPIPYIPHRLREGHGLHFSALERLGQEGVSLVISVDCGITARQAVAQARRKGLDVIVTDHHAVTDQLPPAIAAVNPRRSDSSYPFSELAGVGVAFKLLQALLAGLGKETELASFLDLVALGTVADMVPLQGENRYLVKRGLELLRSPQRPGLRELIQQAGLKPGQLDTEAISWMLGPRLNAASRMEHAMLSYRLLTTPSPEEAQRLAARLEEQNRKRQRLTDEILTQAREMALAQGKDCPLFLVSGDNFGAGLVGVVAGHLADEFYRPVLIVERGERFSRGSARSIPEFSLVAALAECQDLLSRWGGHPMAAGFTVLTRNLPRLHERLLKRAERELGHLDLRPPILIDAELSLSRLAGEVLPQLQRLAPFGKGNPTPTFLARRAGVLDCRPVGNGGEHLRLKLRQDGATWPGIAFDLGKFAAQLTPSMDMVYQLAVDRWGGEDKLELHILDFIPSPETI